MQSFGELMFTQAVRDAQAKNGSRRQNERLYAAPRITRIGPDERAFIESRTTAYLATVNSDGWPYVQHRGGPAGFLKVLGPDSLAFAEYPGNRQFVTQGNLADSARMSMILMDYPQRARLKILGTVETIEEADTPDGLPTPDGVAATRALRLTVQALDWNCPKYITRRFDEAEIARMLGPEMQAMADRIAELEAELARRGG